MKIKILVSLAGVRHCFVPTDVVVVDDAEGQRLVDAGIAEVAPDDAKVTAFVPADDAEPGTGDPRYTSLLGTNMFDGGTVRTRYGDVQLGTVVRSAFDAAAISADEWNALPEESRDELIRAEAAALGWQDETAPAEASAPGGKGKRKPAAA